MLAKLARLAGLGAFGACAGLVALFGVVVFMTLPTAGSGLDMTNAAVTWIAVAGVIAALIVLHVAIGKQLLRLSQGSDKKHPL